MCIPPGTTQACSKKVVWSRLIAVVPDQLLEHNQTPLAAGCSFEYDGECDKLHTAPAKLADCSLFTPRPNPSTYTLALPPSCRRSRGRGMRLCRTKARSRTWSMASARRDATAAFSSSDACAQRKGRTMRPSATHTLCKLKTGSAHANICAPQGPAGTSGMPAATRHARTSHSCRRTCMEGNRCARLPGRQVAAPRASPLR